MNNSRLTLTGLLLLLGALAACQSLPPTATISETEILVTFALPVHATSNPSGSQRGYRGGLWETDLHTRNLVSQFAERHGLRVREGWPIEVLGVYCVAFTVASGADRAQLIERLQSDPSARLVQPNNTYKGLTQTSGWPSYNDPLFDLQFGANTQKLLELHAQTRGAHVRVGIIDSNVDEQHPDLTGRIKHQHTYTNGVDHLQHGTAMAGIIGATGGNELGVVGFAPDAELHVYGACINTHNATHCDSFSIAKALHSAMLGKIQILNLSLAGPWDPLVADLLTVAMNNGMIVIAAANDAEEAFNFPARLDGVHSASEQLGFWFTRGERLSTQAGGGYQLFRGSSVSAAGLTGVATLLRAQHSNESTRAILSSLSQGCEAAASNAVGANACQ